jgi:hypothetical protein
MFSSAAPVAKVADCDSGYSPADPNAYGWSYFEETDCLGQEFAAAQNHRTWDKQGCVQDGQGISTTTHSVKAPETGACSGYTLSGPGFAPVVR